MLTKLFLLRCYISTSPFLVWRVKTSAQQQQKTLPEKTKLYGYWWKKRYSILPMQFNKISHVAQTVKRLSTIRDTWVRSLGREDPLEKEMATRSSILPGKSHGQRSLVGYSPWGHRVGHDWETSIHFTSL